MTHRGLLLSDRGSKDSRSILIIHYPDNHTESFANKVQNITVEQIMFTTGKLKTCLPSLKSAYLGEFKTKMAYNLDCSGCKFIYVGETVKHLTTKVEERRKKNTHVGQLICVWRRWFELICVWRGWRRWIELI